MMDAILTNDKSRLDAVGEYEEYTWGFQSMQNIAEKAMNLQGQINNQAAETKRLMEIDPATYEGGAAQL